MINNIGERIITLRKSNNMSQEFLAEKIGVSRQSISKWERGEAMPDIYNTAGLAKVFGLTIDDFINGDADTVRNETEIAGVEKKSEKDILNEKQKIKESGEKKIIIGIAIIILSAFGFISFPFSSEINILFFGILITLGIIYIIKGGFLLEKYYTNSSTTNNNDLDEEPSKKAKEKKKKDAIGTIISVTVTIIYLYISFVYGLWHPGWLVFLVIPIAYALMDLFDF